jgi:hypothetical protein
MASETEREILKRLEITKDEKISHEDIEKACMLEGVSEFIVDCEKR